jgi:hypothetical protein
MHSFAMEMLAALASGANLQINKSGAARERLINQEWGGRSWQKTRKSGAVNF